VKRCFGEVGVSESWFLRERIERARFILDNEVRPEAGYMVWKELKTKEKIVMIWNDYKVEKRGKYEGARGIIKYT